MTVEILHGDALAVLGSMPGDSVQCCVTSPPYFALRDYGVEGQIGLEESPEAYIKNLVAVFREVRRVLKPDGTFWLNIGDCYNAYNGGRNGGGKISGRLEKAMPKYETGRGLTTTTLKNKDRMLIPARVALALQADGWYVRDEIVWHKPRTTPFPANDRTVASHEMVYLLTKQPRYFFDWAAIEEPAKFGGAVVRYSAKAKNERMKDADPRASAKRPNGIDRGIVVRETRRKRSVWSINPQPFKEAHFATMPTELATLCIKAGTREGDVVLDPFGGAGTTGLAAMMLGRSARLIELNGEYCALAARRLGVEGVPQDGGFSAALAHLKAATARLTSAMEAHYGD